MMYTTEAPKGFLIVGQGEGGVEEWLDPFSALEGIDATIMLAIHYNIEIPWKSCTGNTRIFRKVTVSKQQVESALDLLEDYPGVEFDRESYGEDDDMPGRSGSFLKVFIRKDRARYFLTQINKLQSSLEDFWEASGGWERECDEEIRRKEEIRHRDEAEREANRLRDIRVNREEKEAFETLVSTVSAMILDFHASSEEPFLHPHCTSRILCIRNGSVYVLEYDPYDSEKKVQDARLLAGRLEQLGYPVQRLKQYQPKGVGNIPGFAGHMRGKYQGWLQQAGILTADDPQIAEEATKQRALFLELIERAALPG